jgi:hypothetical protein
MTAIRSFRPGDELAIAEVCLRTADAGADAAGILSDDDLWAAVYALPNVALHPDFAFVAEDDSAVVRGYVVAAPDTAGFDAWFRDRWWPRFHERWPLPARADPPARRGSCGTRGAAAPSR